jgi:hypothetical protein
VLKNVDLDRPVAGVPQAPVVFAVAFVLRFMRRE